MVPKSVVVRVVAAHSAGATITEIAQRLTDEKVPTVQGGVRWWPSTVRAVLSSQAAEDATLEDQKLMMVYGSRTNPNHQ